MPNESEVDREAEAEGQRLISELQDIRERLSDHASRHPRVVDVRQARQDLERAIDIAVQAGSKPHSESAAKLWLGYCVDDYVRVVRADAAALAEHLYR